MNIVIVIYIYEISSSIRLLGNDDDSMEGPTPRHVDYVKRGRFMIALSLPSPPPKLRELMFVSVAVVVAEKHPDIDID